MPGFEFAGFSGVPPPVFVEFSGVSPPDFGFVGIPGYSGFSYTAGIPGTPPSNSGLS